jgi:DNA-binding GntR family transcriptional regulator
MQMTSRARKTETIVASPLQIEIANRIIEMIRNGAVAPGDHLTEEKLSKEYGVSRTPVRVALRLLEDKGFVEVRANAGTFVAAPSSKEKFAALPVSSAGEDELYRSILSDRARDLLPQSLSEAALLARYGASNAVLRRVLLRLVREGLIERRKGHGWTFPPALDTDAAIEDSYQFRKLVECGGLRQPTFKPNLADLSAAKLQHVSFINRLSQSKDNFDPTDFFHMNASFHELLARFSGNRFIEQAVWQQNQLRRFEEYARFVNRPKDLADSCRDHIAIIDAVLENDIDWACALLFRHLTVSATR